MILNNYDQITEEEIRQLSKEELVQAILRVLTLEPRGYSAFWDDSCYLRDDIADAFRGRIV